ncbi:MAG: hypothetical protein J6Y20_04120 [Lachnospiraceae bacterium]|jgi:hypothetical protein|nr:hypothetical protein [Lachnospiraceae bacterium]
MGLKLNFSNKTWLIIAGSVLALAILIVIVRPGKKNEDLSLTSYDGTVTLTFSEVATETSGKKLGNQVRGKIANPDDFFEDFIKFSSEFVGSVDETGALIPYEERKDTGRYIVLHKNRYFYVTLEKEYVSINELSARILDGTNSYYMIFPCDIEINIRNNGSVDYSSLAGVNNFQELKAFYERLGEGYLLKLDEPNLEMRVALLLDGGTVSGSTAIIRSQESYVEIVIESEEIEEQVSEQ